MNINFTYDAVFYKNTQNCFKKHFIKTYFYKNQTFVLSNTQRYFLKKTDRLKSRKAIEILYKNGKNFSIFPFRIQYLVTKFEPGIKAGFSAPTKNFKKATDRNKIKRLIKEAYRLQKNEIEKHQSLMENGLHIFIIYTGKDLPKYDFIAEKTTLVLQKLIKQLDLLAKTD